MAKKSWPYGVTSWEYTVKFAQLLFGVDVAYEKYSHRLPCESQKSFLLFAKGACAQGKPFHRIADFIEPQLPEIEQWEQTFRGNSQRPNKSQQMLSQKGGIVYY